MPYTIQQLAKIASVTTRTLRWYDQIGLLVPVRAGESGYRLYGQKEADRLQEILLYREMGVPLKEIAPLLSRDEETRAQLLFTHLQALQNRQKNLEILIGTVKKTLDSLQGGYEMNDKEKFEGFKKEKLAENDARYGSEIRAAYGEESVEKSRQKFMGLSPAEYEEMQALGEEINKALEAAVQANADPGSEAGHKIFEAHKKWLCYTWPVYTKEAHAGLAEGYVADARFTAYYDRAVPGCAQFLRDAILAAVK